MEHVALYRLYRPMNFDDIVEQEHAVAALRQAMHISSAEPEEPVKLRSPRSSPVRSTASILSTAIHVTNAKSVRASSTALFSTLSRWTPPVITV